MTPLETPLLRQFPAKGHRAREPAGSAWRAGNNRREPAAASAPEAESAGSADSEGVFRARCRARRRDPPPLNCG